MSSQAHRQNVRQAAFFSLFGLFQAFLNTAAGKLVINSIVKKLFNVFPALKSFELYLDRSGETGESWEMGESN